MFTVHNLKHDFRDISPTEQREGPCPTRDVAQLTKLCGGAWGVRVGGEPSGATPPKQITFDLFQVSEDLNDAAAHGDVEKLNVTASLSVNACWVTENLEQTATGGDIF